MLSYETECLKIRNVLVKKVNKILKKQVKDTAGKSWFDMPAPTLTPELKKDLQLLKPNSELIDGLFVPPNDPKKVNKILKKQVKDTAGKSWFDMPAPTLTPELKKDLQLLKLRNVMDPKRHYKKGDSKLNSFPKKRKVQEIEAKSQPGGVDKWKIKGKSSWKRAKQRRH
nr:hypothetical protein [Tanacetum cinerariifolium]